MIGCPSEEGGGREVRASGREASGLGGEGLKTRTFGTRVASAIGGCRGWQPLTVAGSPAAVLQTFVFGGGEGEGRELRESVCACLCLSCENKGISELHWKEPVLMVAAPYRHGFARVLARLVLKGKLRARWRNEGMREGGEEVSVQGGRA